MSVADLRQLIQRDHESLSITHQCELIGLPRSTYYDESPGESKETLSLMMRIDQIYMEHPYYGSRRIRAELIREGTVCSRDRIVRLMRLMGIEGKLPGRKTTRSAPGHKIYPNLLKGLRIDRSDKVWCVDITYTPTVSGPMYLVAIMDWHSRYILAWELSNSLDTEFCIRALEEALSRHPNPEYFHSDQGCQFTSEAFTSILKTHGITISMSGQGRAYDNIFIERFWRSLKTEKLYKEEFRSVFALRKTISEYMLFYNERRPHQALEDAFPIEVYRGVA